MRTLKQFNKNSILVFVRQINVNDCKIQVKNRDTRVVLI